MLSASSLSLSFRPACPNPRPVSIEKRTAGSLVAIDSFVRVFDFFS